MQPGKPTMKIFLPIAKVDAERREVWGYASTEARDDQGEIIKRDALVGALGDYMKFANIREMHQLSAVGVAKEAAVDDKGLYVGAKIVDDQAWQKVVEGVYKGYSIGGRVTKRDPVDAKIITGVVLNEISLVDRPANPEAVFDYWRAAGAAADAGYRFNSPIQIWACGAAEHRHLAKADALRCQQLSGAPFAPVNTHDEPIVSATLEKTENTSESNEPYAEVAYADPGYQADKKKRYPIVTEAHIRAAWNFINRPSNARRYTAAQLDSIKSLIIAAWKTKIDRDGPPSAENANGATNAAANIAFVKALFDVGHIARVIADLEWLRENLQIEAAMEGDGSPQPARLQTIIAELCGFLKEMVAEETGDILDNTTSSDDPDDPRAAEIVADAAGSAGASLVAHLCKGRGTTMGGFGAAVVAKAKCSDADQTLLDLAHHAADTCMRMDGLLFVERHHLAEALDALQAAGAGSAGAASIDGARVAEPGSAMLEPATARSSASSKVDAIQYPSNPGPTVLDLISAAFAKRGAGHQALLDVSHDCVGKLTDNACCATSKASARHSQETLGHLVKAHDHLVAAGADCDAGEFAADKQQAETDLERNKIAMGDLHKTLSGGHGDREALIATLSDILPRLDRLTKRVEEIARTPLPPLAMAKDLTALSKRQDVGAEELSPNGLATAFARMSKEEQTLMLIKASYARPIQPPGLAAGMDPRGE
jgi:phage head maturation protease